MRLSSVTETRHTLWNEDVLDERLTITAAIQDQTAILEFNILQKPEKGGLVASIGKKIKDHPILAGLAASYAVDSLATYFKNKKYTTRFYAKDGSEKNFYKAMVDQLLRTGNYKLVKSGNEGNGFQWELMRVK